VSREKRRHDRYRIQLPVELSVGKKVSRGETVDVSFGGLFVRTEDPPPVRQLVKLELRAPPKDERLALMAMAVFVGPPDPASGMSGVGLQLFGLDPEVRERWEAFVKFVRTRPGTDAGSEPPAAEPGAAEPPSWDQVRPEIRIRVGDVEHLERILQQELERRRMYVRTALYLEPGRRVELLLTHPVTGKSFSLQGEVDDKVERPGFEGLRILLPELAAEEKSALARFVREVRAPTLDLDEGALADIEALEREQAV
jgi:Tfp pilus assembly protein PilZ